MTYVKLKFNKNKKQTKKSNKDFRHPASDSPDAYSKIQLLLQIMNAFKKS